MTSPARLRDSTQIVLSPGAIEDVRAELEARFTLTLHETEECVRIIASPLVIKDVSDFLALRGVSVP
jgi:hypothetical protein